MAYEKNPWQNQFATPDIKQLRAGLRETDVRLFDRMRKRLTDRAELTEDIEWFAEPWFWSITYRMEGCEEPMIIIIASQTDLQVAMPVERELAETLATQKLRRSIQEGLSLVREPYDTRWCVWSVIGSAMADDLNDLLSTKQQSLQLAV